MATDQLPVITQLKLSPSQSRTDATNNARQVMSDQRAREAASFMKRVQLGSLDKQPRPGDIYRSPNYNAGFAAKQPRPLGLLPDHRGKLNLLDELARILPPIPVFPQPLPQPPRTHVNQPEIPTIHGISSDSADNTTKQNVNTHAGNGSTYRLSEQLTQADVLRQEMKQLAQDDPDYLQTLAQLNIREYYTPHSQKRLDRGLLRRRTNTLPPVSKPKVFAPTPTHGRRPVENQRSFGVQFVNFTEQAQLCDRHLSLDQRHALDNEPCERCRLRGGRCARCKALRTGGGYIILDGGELSEDELKRKFVKRFHGGRYSRDDMSGSRQHGRRRSYHNGTESDFDGLGTSSGKGGGNNGRLWSGADAGGDSGKWGGVSDDVQRKDGDGKDDAGRYSSDNGGTRGDGVGGRGRNRGYEVDGRGHYDARGGDSLGDGRVGSALGGRGRSGVDGREWMADESGRQSNMSGRTTSRMSGSRPGSTVGTRPASSMKRGGHGIGGRRRNTELEKRSGAGGRERLEGDDRSDSDDDENRKRRRLKKIKGEDDGRGRDSEEDDHDRSKFNYSRPDTEEDDNSSRSYGNLMRFKRKRDDVKALHATLKDLQGIDPLDYLARYCIIDQSKLPHYRHAYDNVDRDEDDEINIAELDFALKAVNYDLISDAEMNYVHSVLELAGRYKLNFRLFSLIAALSEKVVSLEDMVKRLINKMDFGALEVKMKKCKELFYLLADSEGPVGHEGGVVTSSSLSVELQAGGLTEEHVEFVVDRLNHEGKGIVEFLDYLTYVPLFVEIHDSIYGNPLDFSRTK